MIAAASADEVSVVVVMARGLVRQAHARRGVGNSRRVAQSGPCDSHCSNLHKRTYCKYSQQRCDVYLRTGAAFPPPDETPALIEMSIDDGTGQPWSPACAQMASKIERLLSVPALRFREFTRA